MTINAAAFHVPVPTSRRHRTHVTSADYLPWLRQGAHACCRCPAWNKQPPCQGAKSQVGSPCSTSTSCRQHQNIGRAHHACQLLSGHLIMQPNILPAHCCQGCSGYSARTQSLPRSEPEVHLDMCKVHEFIGTMWSTLQIQHKLMQLNSCGAKPGICSHLRCR